jgi:hypothetical protein
VRCNVIKAIVELLLLAGSQIGYPSGAIYYLEGVSTLK